MKSSLFGPDAPRCALIELVIRNKMCIGTYAEAWTYAGLAGTLKSPSLQHHVMRHSRQDSGEAR